MIRCVLSVMEIGKVGEETKERVFEFIGFLPAVPSMDTTIVGKNGAIYRVSGVAMGINEPEMLVGVRNSKAGTLETYEQRCQYWLDQGFKRSTRAEKI